MFITGPIGLIFGTSTAALIWAYNNPDQVKDIRIPIGSPFLRVTIVITQTNRQNQLLGESLLSMAQKITMTLWIKELRS